MEFGICSENWTEELEKEKLGPYLLAKSIFENFTTFYSNFTNKPGQQLDDIIVFSMTPMCSPFKKAYYDEVRLGIKWFCS